MNTRTVFKPYNSGLDTALSSMGLAFRKDYTLEQHKSYTVVTFFSYSAMLKFSTEFLKQLGAATSENIFSNA
jgi:hypothetical protein